MTNITDEVYQETVNKEGSFHTKQSEEAPS